MKDKDQILKVQSDLGLALPKRLNWKGEFVDQSYEEAFVSNNIISCENPSDIIDTLVGTK